MTQILIGHDLWKLRENVKLLVYWREAQVSNHHVGVAGTSGAGKTHWIRQFVTGMPMTWRSTSSTTTATLRSRARRR